MQQDTFTVEPFVGIGIFESESNDRPLKVCIATEEIVGPVRNGGIASTYFHLARTLAADGHKVTVLYLKGNKCENETIEHWINWYGELGIEFVPLPEDMAGNLECAAERWQGPMYGFFLWLKNNDRFDVVHVSEWRGGAYYVLLAKRQGLAFQDTIFLVKTSSPWIWNRHYSLRVVDAGTELTRMYGERRMVELADVVIGGSAHLLNFMKFKGYRLPENRTFVQPNIIDMQDLKIEENRPDYQFGEKVKSGDLVFFGRLEARKGLEIFCEALDRLVQAGVTPKHVTFLGKQGNRMPSRPDIDTKPYIWEKAKGWPFPVEIIDHFDQDKALGYLCEKPRIAIMPSLIENSTMAVYETIVHKIPFLATRVGGTPELIDPAHHDETLCDAHPESLTNQLIRILKEGGTVAKGGFNYEESLAQWRNFHSFLAGEIEKHGAPATLRLIEEKCAKANGVMVNPAKAKGVRPEKVSVCIYHYNRPAYLESLIDSLHFQDRTPDEIVVINDGPVHELFKDVMKTVKERYRETAFVRIDQPHRCIGPAWNAAAEKASGDLLVFMNAETNFATQEMIQSFVTAAEHSTAAAFSAVARTLGPKAKPKVNVHGKRTILPMGGDLATAFFFSESLGGSCFAVRKAVFEELGGFADTYHIAGVEREFYARLIVKGYDLEVIPLVLYWERMMKDQTKVDWNYRGTEYLGIMPLIEDAPHYLEHILLATRAAGPQAHRLKIQNRNLQNQLSGGAPAKKRWVKPVAVKKKKKITPKKVAAFVYRKIFGRG